MDRKFEKLKRWLLCVKPCVWCIFSFNPYNSPGRQIYPHFTGGEIDTYGDETAYSKSQPQLHSRAKTYLLIKICLSAANIPKHVFGAHVQKFLYLNIIPCNRIV